MLISGPVLMFLTNSLGLPFCSLHMSKISTKSLLLSSLLFLYISWISSMEFGMSAGVLAPEKPPDLLYSFLNICFPLAPSDAKDFTSFRTEGNIICRGLSLFKLFP